MSRGNGRKRLSFGHHDRLRLLRRMRDNLTTRDVVLYAYVPVDNHCHLLVKTRRISRAVASSYGIDPAVLRQRGRRSGERLPFSEMSA